MNTLEGNSNIPVDFYVRQARSYYMENKQTSPTHVDTLILLYRLTENQKAFELLLDCHYFLLMKILRELYNKYRGFLYEEDYNELRQKLYLEFFRRVLFYKIPPEAPFSKYVKLYLKRWLNTYIKITVDKNKRVVLWIDWEKPEEE